MDAMRKIIILILLGWSAISHASTEQAVFAGGCFWCMQADFDKLNGVESTIAGYDGGTAPNPTYETVSAGSSGYSEVVKVIFDNKKITYSQVVNYFLHHVDPTNNIGQFCDTGSQYKSKVLYLNPGQQQQALSEFKKAQKQVKPFYTELVPATTFYPAEDYHQEYYRKNDYRYHFYRWNCGRDAKVKEVWGEK